MTNIIDASNRFNKDKKPKTMHVESPVYKIGSEYMVMDISTQLDLISYKNIHYISLVRVGDWNSGSEPVTKEYIENQMFE